MQKFFVGLLLTFSSLTFAGNLVINTELIGSYNKEELKQFYQEKRIPKSIIPIRFDVDIYKILYSTPNYDGSQVTASGLFFVPRGIDNVPMISYQHGTQVEKRKKTGKLKGEVIIAAALAADGYAVAMPDYIGMGEGEGFHPYMHAETQASATIDMIRACKVQSSLIGLTLSDKLFLMGYSQGGYATMAAQQMMESQYADEFNIIASAPMSGPYNLSGMESSLLEQENYPHPEYLAYLLLSYNMVYHFFDHASEIFAAPYDSIIPAMFNGEYTMNEINAVMPKKASLLIKPEIVKGIETNPDHPFWKALKENDVYDWTPKAPVKLCYCEGDEQVDYKNSILAYKSFKKNGAKDVRLKSANRKLGHYDCAYYAMVYGKMWLDSFRDNRRNKKGPIGPRFLLGIAKMFGAGGKG